MELDYLEKDRLVNQILSGSILIDLEDYFLFVKEPSPEQKLIADNIYKKQLINAELNDIWTLPEMFEEKKRLGMWSDADQKEIDDFPKRLEALKIELYQAYFQYKRRDGIKKALEELRLRDSIVNQKLDTWKHTTTEGYALSCKIQYLISVSTFTENNTLFFSSANINQSLLDEVLYQYTHSRMDEKTLRYLARNEPWRSIYSAGKAQGGIRLNDSSLLTFEQRSILLWSKMYDSLYERGSECPPEEVIEDDDCLDGWMVLEHRKIEKERKSNSGYNPGSKYNKADEVFIPVDNVEDINRVNQMNSPAALIRKQQRMNALSNAGGKLEDKYMPDSQQKIRELIMKEVSNHGNKK